MFVIIIIHALACILAAGIALYGRNEKIDKYVSPITWAVVLESMLFALILLTF